MAFTKGDRSEIESLLGKVTTTMDAVGRSMRDVRLVGRLNPHFPTVLGIRLEELETMLKGMLVQFEHQEGLIVEALNVVSLPE